MLQRLLWMLLGWSGLVTRPTLVAKMMAVNPSNDLILPGQLIVVGGKGYQKWAYMRCPCGCDEVIMLSLSKSSRPRWTVSIDTQGRPTINPSVRQVSGCFSHFWVRKGMIEWCDDTGLAQNLNYYA